MSLSAIARPRVGALASHSLDVQLAAIYAARARQSYVCLELGVAILVFQRQRNLKGAHNRNWILTLQGLYLAVGIGLY